MKSSYIEDDITLLLKDITGLVEPLPTKEREKKIQSGTHYSEMLPLEYRPTDKYIEIYEKAFRYSVNVNCTFFRCDNDGACSRYH